MHTLPLQCELVYNRHIDTLPWRSAGGRNRHLDTIWLLAVHETAKDAYGPCPVHVNATDTHIPMPPVKTYCWNLW